MPQGDTMRRPARLRRLGLLLWLVGPGVAGADPGAPGASATPAAPVNSANSAGGADRAEADRAEGHSQGRGRGRGRARPALSLDLSGMLAVLGGPRTVALTLGGPRLGLSIGEFGVGFSAYPSLVYSRLWSTDRLRPTLGVGGEIGYYGATVVVAVYYSGERYVPAVGLGYRFVLRRQITRKRRRARTPDDLDAP